MLKVAIVGVGGMGGGHFNAYVNAKDLDIVAACDIRIDRLKEVVGDKNVELYTDFNEMLKNEKIDILDICTPSYLHADMAVKALECGINVICEKPMATTFEDAQRIKIASEKSGKFFMVAHVVRFTTRYEYLKEIIDSKKYGKILRLDMKRLSSIPTWSWNNWMLDESKSGLTPLDLSIHDVDFMQYLFGNPKNIQCAYYKKKNNNDYVIANHIYDDFIVSTEATWFNQDYPFSATYNAIFENGYISSTPDGIIENGEMIKLDELSNKFDSGINIKISDSYTKEILYFADCVKNKIEPKRVTVDSSLNSIRLIEEMKRCCIEI